MGCYFCFSIYRFYTSGNNNINIINEMSTQYPDAMLTFLFAFVMITDIIQIAVLIFIIKFPNIWLRNNNKKNKEQNGFKI